MERALAQHQLKQTESHLALDARRVAEQRRQVVILESAGRDAAHARALLAQAEQLHAAHLAEFERLRRELKRSRSP